MRGIADFKPRQSLVSSPIDVLVVRLLLTVFVVVIVRVLVDVVFY